MKKCPNCGYESDSKYCPECGTKMDVTVESEEHVESIQEVTVSLVSEDNETMISEGKTALQEGADVGESVIDTQTEEPEDSMLVLFDTDRTTTGLVTDNKKKRSKRLIIGGLVAVLAVIFIMIISNLPKVTSISAAYNGYRDKGETVDNNSPITVTATFDNGKTEEVTGWNVDSIVLKPGFNDITITYKDQSTLITIYSPTMVDGKYVASVEEIKDLISYYAYNKIDGFSGISNSDDGTGIYTLDGVGFYARVNFTQKSGSENEGVEGSEIPNTVIYGTILASDEYDTKLQTSLDCAAVVLASVDPVINYDDAQSKILDCINGALDSAKDTGIGSYDLQLDNLKIMTTIIGQSGSTLVLYSFQEL